MGQAIPRQHPAVVLRSQYAHLRNLLAVAMIALVGLSGAVVILANDGDDVSGTTSATAVESLNQPGGARFDGGPDEGTHAIVASRGPSVRFDGGPEEGTHAIVASRGPSVRFDGGPEEGTRGIVSQSTASDGGLQESPAHPGFNTD